MHRFSTYSLVRLCISVQNCCRIFVCTKKPSFCALSIYVFVFSGSTRLQVKPDVLLSPLIAVSFFSPLVSGLVGKYLPIKLVSSMCYFNTSAVTLEVIVMVERNMRPKTSAVRNRHNMSHVVVLLHFVASAFTTTICYTSTNGTMNRSQYMGRA